MSHPSLPSTGMSVHISASKTDCLAFQLPSQEAEQTTHVHPCCSGDLTVVLVYIWNIHPAGITKCELQSVSVCQEWGPKKIHLWINSLTIQTRPPRWPVDLMNKRTNDYLTRLDSAVKTLFHLLTTHTHTHTHTHSPAFQSSHTAHVSTPCFQQIARFLIIHLPVSIPAAHPGLLSGHKINVSNQSL